MSSPRGFKSHLRYNLVPGTEPAESPAKYIYVYRNPKDTAVSGFFQAKSLVMPDITWEKYLDRFLSGQVGYGPMLDHILGWWQHKGDVHHCAFIHFKHSQTWCLRMRLDKATHSTPLCQLPYISFLSSRCWQYTSRLLWGHEKGSRRVHCNDCWVLGVQSNTTYYYEDSRADNFQCYETKLICKHVLDGSVSPEWSQHFIHAQGPCRRLEKPLHRWTVS